MREEKESKELEIGKGGLDIMEEKHDIPKENVHRLVFSKLEPESRDVQDSEAIILPFTRVSDGEYFCAVKHPDDSQFATSFLLWEEDENFGWCRCSEFSYLGVCRHLYIIYSWQSGMLKPKNPQSSEKLKDTLDEL